MGIGLWLFSGVAAFLFARSIPLRRTSKRLGELLLATLTAFLLGVAATAMDFGGWKELDPRAGAFSFLGALAILGAVRAVRK